MTLELFLNVAWLAIVIAAFAAYAFWARHANSAARFRVGVAIACGLALLFPIISVSDDLLPNVAALEEWTAGRRANLIAIVAVIVPFVDVAALLAHHVTSHVARVTDGVIPTPLESFATVSSLRAPPQA